MEGLRGRFLKIISSPSIDSQAGPIGQSDVESDTGDSMYHDIVYKNDRVTEGIRQKYSSLPQSDRKAELLNLLKERNDTGLTILEVAIDKGKERLIGFVLQQLSTDECYEVISNQHPGLGWTLLYRAVVKGKAAIIRLLLGSIERTRIRQLIDIRMDNGMTALTKAPYVINSSVIRALIEVFEQRQRLAILIEKRSDEELLIHQQVMARKHDLMQWILDTAIDDKLTLLKAENQYGRNSIHLAAKTGDKQMMGIILQSQNKGDNSVLVLKQDVRGMTALHYVTSYTSYRLAGSSTRLLLNSIDAALIPHLVTQKSKSGKTPFEIAYQLGNISAMQIIARALKGFPGLLVTAATPYRSDPQIYSDVSIEKRREQVPIRPMQPVTNDLDIDELDSSKRSGDELMSDITESLDQFNRQQKSANDAKNKGTAMLSTRSQSTTEPPGSHAKHRSPYSRSKSVSSSSTTIPKQRSFHSPGGSYYEPETASHSDQARDTNTWSSAYSERSTRQLRSQDSQEDKKHTDDIHLKSYSNYQSLPAVKCLDQNIQDSRFPSTSDQDSTRMTEAAASHQYMDFLKDGGIQTGEHSQSSSTQLYHGQSVSKEYRRVYPLTLNPIEMKRVETTLGQPDRNEHKDFGTLTLNAIEIERTKAKSRETGIQQQPASAKLTMNANEMSRADTTSGTSNGTHQGVDPLTSTAVEMSMLKSNPGGFTSGSKTVNQQQPASAKLAMNANEIDRADTNTGLSNRTGHQGVDPLTSTAVEMSRLKSNLDGFTSGSKTVNQQQPASAQSDSDVKGHQGVSPFTLDANEMTMFKTTHGRGTEIRGQQTSTQLYRGQADSNVDALTLNAIEMERVKDITYEFNSEVDRQHLTVNQNEMSVMDPISASGPYDLTLNQPEQHFMGELNANSKLSSANPEALTVNPLELKRFSEHPLNMQSQSTSGSFLPNVQNLAEKTGSHDILTQKTPLQPESTLSTQTPTLLAHFVQPSSDESYNNPHNAANEGNPQINNNQIHTDKSKSEESASEELDEPDKSDKPDRTDESDQSDEYDESKPVRV